MHFLNKKIALIDGWLVDQDLSCLINPSTLVDNGIVTEQQFEDLIDRGLKNWNSLFISESDLYCENSSELFRHVSTKSHSFHELSNGSIRHSNSIKSQNPGDDVLKTFSLDCHSLTLTDGRDVYIHSHMGGNNDLKKCLNTDLVSQSKYYTAIAFDTRSFIEIEGFLIDLKSHNFCSLFDIEFQKEISAPVWLGLRSISFASVFEKLQISDLNYRITDCKSLFYVMHENVYVNFQKNEQGSYVCKICEREVASNIALPVSTVVNGAEVVKYIVLSEKIQDYGPSLHDLERALGKESFSVDSKLSQHYPLMECDYFDYDEEVETPNIMYVPGWEIWQLPTKIMQDVLEPKIYHFGMPKHIQNLHNTLLERMLQGGQWKIKKIKEIMAYDPELASLLVPVLPEYEKLHKEAILMSLKTGLSTFTKQIHNEVRNKDGELIPNIKIMERLLIDIKEGVMVSPKEAKYRFEDNITFKYNLLDWSVFILKEPPIEIFSRNLFDTVQTKKVHDIGTKLNGRRYVVLSFGKFGTIYLYEGKDSMQTFKTPLVVDKAGSPRIRFYISELNGLLDVSEHLSNFEMLWKAIKEAGSQNKSD
ncbi:uncharacterized protein DI49_4787 [Saccharomyces eubayanus]|uniref:uncharacterized protein n=1 Tax=Saccharomyces eubayanus TaxID=1080349 RepID=UPI0006C47B97|nr:hypothetical protein DI49_4787 [Saccharomyces eubayanus]KOG97205.1 hypothetical protein DI49_4787 [Saccharomyces eubayanus]